MNGARKDWSGLDTNPLDPHTLAIAIEDAKGGCTDAARRLLKAFAQGLRRGGVDLALVSYVADAMDAIADSETPAKTAAKALNLQHPGRGRPRSDATLGKHLRAATEVAKLVALGETRSKASQAVSEIANIEANRVRDAYRQSSDREVAVQIAMDGCDAISRIEGGGST